LRRRTWLALLAVAVLVLAACYPPPDRLPDLGMARLADFSIQRTNGRTLLRFSTTIVNVGAGPFQVRGQRSSTGDPDMSVTQHVFQEGGGRRDVATPATMFYSGDGHNHWHVRDLERYELKRLDNGVKVGTGAKHGFCFWDNVAYRLSLPGAPQSRVYSGCGTASNLTVTVGLSVGWGDRYPSTLVGQYIDITGLTAGSYRLIATADPSNWFVESNGANNATWVDLQIRSNDVSVKGWGPSA
jgi:hypothetical protein